MADNDPLEAPFNGWQQLQEDVDALAKLKAILNKGQTPQTADHTTDDLEDALGSYDVLSSLLQLSINGESGLPDQKVSVTYLKNDQLLVIPSALGMNPIQREQGWTGAIDLLIERYWKVATMTYATLLELVKARASVRTIRATVDALQLTVQARPYEAWNTAVFLRGDEGDPPGMPDFVYGYISVALQFNCDLRDMGFLLRPESTVTDNAWKDISAITAGRIRSKLHARTIQSISALNLPNVAGAPMAAYMRAYGLSVGLLAARNSAGRREYIFSARMALAENVAKVNAYQNRYPTPLITPCAQLLAVFGLFHLAKDHTFRTGDANMARIGASYLRTLRTDIDSDALEDILSNPEPFVRTAPHPFGLAQTYWFAQVLGKLGKLVLPLIHRLDTTPPPVQRLMIAHAARNEWLSLPAGRIVDTLYSEYYPAMESEVQRAKTNAPAFSALHRLYGIAEQEIIDTQLMSNIVGMMPAIHGYISTYHVDDKGAADGLGHALSLRNIERDQRSVVNLWAAAWEKYGNSVQDAGIVEFVQHIQQMSAATGGAG